MTPPPALLTAEEYALLPDTGQPTELVRGRVVGFDWPTPRHGEICAQVGRLVGNHAARHALGHTVLLSGIKTGHDPDSVRGADVSFYSFARIPPGPLPQGYLDVVPELVFEVRSPTDLWSKVYVEVGEYFDAGVSVVCVFDEQTHTAHVYHAEEFPRILSNSEELTFPGILGDFRVAVKQFFQ
jgi:Uma2 family endonuclease